jgi:hypothetical protein
LRRPLSSFTACFLDLFHITPCLLAHGFLFTIEGQRQRLPPLLVAVLVLRLFLRLFGDNEVFKGNTGLPGPGIRGFAFHHWRRCFCSDVSFGGVFGEEVARDHISKGASKTAEV